MRGVINGTLRGGPAGVTIDTMSQAEKLLQSIRNNPKNVRFSDACSVAESFFGSPRIVGSHRVYTTKNGHRVNLQPGKNGQAKSYQVEQLLEAIDAVGNE